MRTEEQLLEVHNKLKRMLEKLINNGLKFEVSLSMARRIIRADYHTIDVEVFEKESPRAILDDTVHIMVDPSSTPKNVYMKIIDNIFAASSLKTAIKDDSKFSKTQRLYLLVEINYLHTYLSLSQVQVSKYLEKHKIVGITYLDEFDNSKEINRYIKLAKAIKTTTDNISPEEYLIY